jgi:hypothetical protein
MPREAMLCQVISWLGFVQTGLWGEALLPGAEVLLGHLGASRPAHKIFLPLCRFFS